MKKPLIGVTLHYKESLDPKSVSVYQLKEPYIHALEKAGAIPVLLPYAQEAVMDYVDLIDGLLITGGPCDVPPAYYGQEITSPTVTVIEARSKFEFALAEKALEKNIPVLGICGGHQVLNVLFGGTLIQDIHESCPEALEHSSAGSAFDTAHTVTVTPLTRLAHIAGGVQEFPVNTSHHQAVLEAGPDVIVNARAPDGIIEGLEHPDYHFCVGVQWHPEYHTNPHDKALFGAFVTACHTKK